MLDAIVQDLHYAVRGLRPTPGFAAVAILSLALGIGANTAIFTLIDSRFLRALPVSHPELLQVTTGKREHFSNRVWEELRARQDVFSGLFAAGAPSYTELGREHLSGLNVEEILLRGRMRNAAK